MIISSVVSKQRLYVWILLWLLLQETGEKSSSGNSTPVRKARTVFRPNRCDTPDLANVIREKPNQSMGRRAVHELIRRVS